jgi:hypothetical protein
MRTTRRVFSGNEGNETTKFVNPCTEQFFAWPQRDHKLRAIWNPAMTSSGDSVCSMICESSETQEGR